MYLGEKPEKIPLNIVSGLGVEVAHRNLLDALGSEVIAANLHLGDVFGPDGIKFPEYATFRGRFMAIIRGNEQSSHRICASCGRHVYFPMGKKYLVEPLAPGVDVAESEYNQLIISETVHARVSMMKWRKLTTEKFQLHARPKDGLDCPGTVEN